MQRIYSVDGVDVYLLKSWPAKIGLSASGRVSSSGWTNPQLLPWVYVMPPQDGIQDFDFVASLESTGILLPVVLPIAATAILDRDPADYWGPNCPLVGVRVHSRTNSVDATLADNSTLEVSSSFRAPTTTTGTPTTTTYGTPTTTAGTPRTELVHDFLRRGGLEALSLVKELSDQVEGEVTPEMRDNLRERLNRLSGLLVNYRL